MDIPEAEVSEVQIPHIKTPEECGIDSLQSVHDRGVFLRTVFRNFEENLDGPTPSKEDLRQVRLWLENLMEALGEASEEAGQSHEELQLWSDDPVRDPEVWEKLSPDNYLSMMKVIRKTQTKAWEERKRCSKLLRLDLIRPPPNFDQIRQAVALAREDASTVVQDIHPRSMEHANPLVLPGETLPADLNWWKVKSERLDSLYNILTHVMKYSHEVRQVIEAHGEHYRKAWVSKSEVCRWRREWLFDRIPDEKQVVFNKIITDTLGGISAAQNATTSSSSLQSPD